MARLYPRNAQSMAGDPQSVSRDAQSVTYTPAEMAQQMQAQNGAGITTPPEQDFNTPAMAGSMQQFLADNLGEYVIIEFLVGTQTLTQKAGVLYAVGTSVVTLYEEVSRTFVTCDIFSVKFVTFFLPGHRPWQANHPLFPTDGMSGIAAHSPDGSADPLPSGNCFGKY